MLVVLVSAACSKPASRRANTAPASSTSTSTSTVVVDHHEPDAPETRPLDSARRADLGIPPPGQVPGPLPPLSEAQWSRPELVAVRYVLVDTNYSAAEDPAAVMARRATYASERLRSDLASSSSGAARLEEQRRQGLSFRGEVLGVATAVEGDTATVTLTVRRSTAADGVLTGAPRVGFHQLRLVRQSTDGHWLVVAVALS